MRANQPIATRPRQAAGPVAVIDVGGTDTKTGLVHPGGLLTEVRSVPTPHTPDIVSGVLDVAERHVTRLRPDHPDLAGIGLVVPGIVDDDAQVAVLATNMGWRDVPFATMLAERTGLPARLGHDVSAAGLAETHSGAAAGAQDAAVIVIGTGIAAALFTGGRPVRSSGYAGEIGHAPVMPDGEPCPCGARGCLEAHASASAIARRYTARSGIQVAGAEAVLQAAERGDESARAVWDEATTALARAIVHLASVLAPQVVVIGGGLSRAGAALLEPVNRKMSEMLTVQRRPQVHLATLGSRAGLYGAGLLAGAAPAGEHPADERPVGEHPAGEQPAVEQPAGEQPAGEQPAAERPTGDQPTGGQPAEGAGR